MSSKLERNKATANAFMTALSTLDIPALAGMMAPDFKIVTTGSSVLSGVTTIDKLPALTEKLKAKLPNGVEVTILDLLADGDRVAVEARGKATTSAGKPYNQQYLFLFDIKDGKISVMTEYLDTKLLHETFS